MKKLIYIASLAIVFVGCETSIEQRSINEVYNGQTIKILTIDNCEYLYINNNITTLSHKGNCKYCIERNSNK